MKPDRRDYTVDPGPSPGSWFLRGVMRLDSPEAYVQAFAPIVAELAEGREITLDLSQVVFLNSSGIRALADVLLAARDRRCLVRIFGSASVPWQKKLATSISGLFPEVEMRIDR